MALPKEMTRSSKSTTAISLWLSVVIDICIDWKQSFPQVAEEMCEAAEKRLRSAFPNMAIDISRFKEGQEKAIGNGVQIV